MIGNAPAQTAKLRRLRRLTEISRALTHAASLEEVFRLTVDRSAELLDSQQALLLVAGGDGPLALRAAVGVDAAVAARLDGPLSESVVAGLAQRLGVDAARLLAVPLVVSGRITGLLVVVRTDGSSVSEHDEWLLSAVADQAAIALEQTRLNETAARREQLIGVVGHDLRRPLHSISLAAQRLLLTEGLGETETTLVRRISGSASLAARLVGQLVDLTRSRLGGGLTLERRPFDLGELCRELVAETGLACLDRALQVEWSGELAGEWDRDRMHQLLANLVDNAVQHGEPASPIALRFVGSGPEVILEVGSRGPPIAPELLPVVFEAFRKVRAPGSRGLGLGLFIAQQIAHAHGGAITVTSTADAGTWFCVRLPREAGAQPKG